MKEGRVQTPRNLRRDKRDYLSLPAAPNTLILDKKRPGEGYKHLLTLADVRQFIALLPDWNELSSGLNAIVLSPGEDGQYGWYGGNGIVLLCAWPLELWRPMPPEFIRESRPLLDRLGVVWDAPKRDNDWPLLHWTEEQARAYQLMDTLLHELGHHHDRITTRRKIHCGRGEPYADAYARKHNEQIWERYLQRFGI